MAPVVGWLVGLFLAFRGMIWSGFALIPGNEGDPRFINYILEHGYRWLMGHSLHRDFWNPPIFYPAQNTAAFSDVLLSAGPFYWCWRWLGFLPDTAFQLWLLTVCSLNFWSAYAFLRNCLRLPAVASSLGAFLFAFASSRLSQLVHPQLQLHFFTVVALYALLRFFQAQPEESGVASRWSPRVWIVVFGLACVAQLYASFYLGWFLGMALLAALLWALVVPSLRPRLLTTMKAHALALLGAFVLSAAVLAPLAHHYHEAGRVVHEHIFQDMRNFVPTYQTWCYLGGENWLYGHWSILKPSGIPRYGREEHHAGIGLCTTLLAAIGLFRRRQMPSVGLLLLCGVTLIVCVTMFPFGFTLWKTLRIWLPGGEAIRVLTRAGLLLLIPAAVGAACFVSGRKSAWVVAGIVAVCVVEQGRHIPNYDKHKVRQGVQALARQVDPNCRAFFHSLFLAPDVGASPTKWHLDAMWAQLQSNVPTINGYSGNGPPCWGLDNQCIKDPEHEREIASRFRAWLARHGLQEADVCWIRTLVSE